LSDDESDVGLKAKVNVRMKQIEKASVGGESLTIFLERSLARAQQAAEERDSLTAISICDAILKLYQNNSEAESAVLEATKMKESLTAKLPKE